MDDVFCNQCGHANPDNANFCSSCGAVLDVRGQDHTITLAPVEPETGPPSAEVSVPVDELPEGAGMLVVKRGPGAGSKFVLDRAVVSAGRHPDSDIFLDDVTVSRRHAELVRRGDRYVLRDAGSLNGTYLNRERIEEAVVANGDEVQIGRFKLVFLATPGTAEGG
ncbi:MAG: zinc-ribbon and FHA domain-containing protein [Actinomycetota bacterium]|nr:zinc-ribbon and FHA domain-containing protein [Actinomycetota bacterium]